MYLKMHLSLKVLDLNLAQWRIIFRTSLEQLRLFLFLSFLKAALFWLRCRSNFLLILQDQTAIIQENNLFILIIDFLIRAFQSAKLLKRGEQNRLISFNNE